MVYGCCLVNSVAMILVFVYTVVVFADGLVTGSGLGTGLRVVRLWGVWRFLRAFSCLDCAFCCFGLWFVADLWFGLGGLVDFAVDLCWFGSGSLPIFLVRLLAVCLCTLVWWVV